MSDIEVVRNPTKDNYLRQETKGYLTEKAAAFMDAYKAGRYQAAVYIKEQADAVFIYARKVGILTDADGQWYTGQEGREPLFHQGFEAKCRQKVDFELRQSEVLRRFKNLVRYTRNAVSTAFDVNTAVRVNAVLSETLGKIEKASGE